MAKVVPFPKIYRPGSLRTKVDSFLATLEGLPELAGGGYQIKRAGVSELALARNGHVLGVWRVLEGRYLYTPTSHRQPTFESEDLTEAARHARELVRPATRDLTIERRGDQRWPVRCLAVLCTANDQIDAVVEDVSAGGLKLRTGDELFVSEPLTVALLSYERLQATIAWNRHRRLGAKWPHPLSPHHDLLTLARRGRI